MLDFLKHINGMHMKFRHESLGHYLSLHHTQLIVTYLAMLFMEQKEKMARDALIFQVCFVLKHERHMCTCPFSRLSTLLAHSPRPIAPQVGTGEGKSLMIASVALASLSQRPRQELGGAAAWTDPRTKARVCPTFGALNRALAWSRIRFTQTDQDRTYIPVRAPPLNEER